MASPTATSRAGKEVKGMENQIIKVTLEFTDKTYIAEGKDAESWLGRVNSLEMLGHSHGMGDWDKWTTVIKKKSN